MKSILLSLFVFSFLIFSCKKEMNHKHPCGDCNKDQVCTKEFKSLVVQLTNSAGSPVKLDSYQTIQVRTGKVIELKKSAWEDSVHKTNGTYVFWSDELAKWTEKQGEEVVFKGYIDGSEVVSHTFIVGFDCCHVFEQSGNTTLVLANLD